MATVRNVSPLGALDFPLIGGVVEAGETFEVPDEVAAALAEQVGTWELVTPPAKTTAKATKAAATPTPQEG